jgi:heptosyltransferase II
MSSTNTQFSRHKILIIGPSWVGDMVMAQSLFIRIKELHQNAMIDVLAPSWSRPIIERMPEVNRAIDMPLGHGLFKIGMRRALGVKLRKEHYDQAIVLPNSWKSALIPWFANIPLRTGWKGEMRYGLLNDCRILDKQTLPFMVERFVALAHPPKNIGKANIQHCPIPALKANSNNIAALLEKFSLHTNQPVLALCPGAEFGSSKQWPAAHYAATAKAMIQRGYQIWIMGSSADESIALEIHQKLQEHQTEYLTRLCGQTSLEEAIDLLSVADHVVSNDSGLMHIASALNKPLVALYGSTSSEFTPPLSTAAETLSVSVDCGPCFQRECPEKHHKCMQELHPTQVIHILDK